LLEGGGERLLTRGVKRLIDVILSLLGVGVALGAAPEGDLAYSIVLALAGLAAGTPLPLVALGSVPVEALAWAGLGDLAPLAAAGLRLARAVGLMHVSLREAGSLGHVIDRAVAQAGVLAGTTLIGGGIAFYLVEGGVEGSGVHSFWDALWLALVTMTTVGYGDVVPVTPQGRLVAVMVMLVGIGVFTFFLSSLAVGLSGLVLVGDDTLPPLERKKRALADMVRNLESLSDEEFQALINDLRMVYLIATADKRSLEIDLSPEALGVRFYEAGEASA